MKRSIENSPATLHFVDDGDFISLFDQWQTSLIIANEKDYKSIPSFLQKLHSLKITNLSIDGRKLADLASTLAGSKVDRLNLSGNMIGTHRLRYLPSAFDRLMQLRELKLYSNLIGEAACEALCASLPGWSNLEGLYLGRNRLNNRCCAMLANALRGNTTITTLDLRQNPAIDGEGASQFIKVLRNGETVESIMNSNHQLVIGICAHPRAPELYQNLIYINADDISANQKIRRKVATVVFRGELSANHLARMPVALMPYLIHFMGDSGNGIEINRGCPFAAVYHLIRNCDCSELFSFPSAERLRIESLEREVKELRENVKAKDDAVRALEAKVKVLEEAAASKKRRLT